MKLENLNGQKLTKPNFSEIFSYCEKALKHVQNMIVFFGFYQKFNALCLFYSKNGV